MRGLADPLCALGLLHLVVQNRSIGQICFFVPETVNKAVVEEIRRLLSGLQRSPRTPPFVLLLQMDREVARPLFPHHFLSISLPYLWIFFLFDFLIMFLIITYLF